MISDKLSLNTFDAVIKDNYVWFSNQSFNGLFRIHIKTHVTEFVQFFANESLLTQQLHFRCYLDENRIIFLPWASNKIQVYDIASGNISTLVLDCYKAHICGVIESNGSLYLFPFFRSGHLYKMDLSTSKISKCEAFNYSVNEWMSDEHSILSYNYVSHENQVIFAVSDTNEIGAWDLSDDRLVKKHINSPRISILSSCNGRRFVCSATSSKLSEINMVSHSENLICGKCNLLKNNKSTVPYTWYRIDECNGKLFVFPWNADGIYEIVNSKLEQRLSVSTFDFSDTLSEYPIFMGWVTVGTEIWLLPCRLRTLLICDSNMNVIEGIHLYCEDDNVISAINNELIKQRIKNSGNILFESPELGLEDFMNAVTTE